MTEAFKPVSSNLTSLVLTPSPNSNAEILEYVATFPNVTVSTGSEYQACVMTTKDLELLCKTGHNSPASRPEFVDINLDEVTASGTEQLGTEEQPARIESKIRTENKGNSNHHQIMAGAIVVLRLVLHLQYLPLEPQLHLLHLLRFLLVRFAQWVLKLAQTKVRGC